MRDVSIVTGSTRGRIFVLLTALVVMPAIVYAQSVTATWDPSPPSENVASYDVCIGSAAGSCNVQTASVPGTQVAFAFVPAGGVMRYVSVRAINAGGTGPYSSPISFSIPSLAQPANQVAIVGVPITPLALTVTDPDGSALTFSHTGLPVGLSINSATRQIIGTPAAAGTYNVTVFVSDNLETVSRSFTWTVNQPLTLSAVSVSPNAGTGSTQVFTALFTDSLGVADIKNARVRFVSTTANGSGGPGTCTASYSAAGGSLSLQNDAATGWLVGSFGSGTLSNSQCTIDLAGSSVSANGNDLSLTLSVTFSGSFGGAKNIYMRGKAVGGGSTGWQLRGSWTVPSSSGPGVPTAVSVTPGSGSGSAGTFVFQYSDSAGATDLASVKVRFVSTAANGPGAAAGTCTLSYDPTGNSLALMNDAGTGWQVATLGAGILWNSQCAVSLAQSSATMNGNDLALSLEMTFTAAFAGSKNAYMRASTVGGADTDWQIRGSWMVIAPAGGTPLAVSMTPGNGTGTSATVALLYQDTMSVTDLDSVRVRFWRGEGLGWQSGVGSCTVSYEPATSSVSLLNDAATDWLTGTLGVGTLTNSQCTVNLTGSSAGISGTNFLTVTLSIDFKPASRGVNSARMLAKTVGGVSTGWQYRGYWIVP